MSIIAEMIFVSLSSRYHGKHWVQRFGWWIMATEWRKWWRAITTESHEEIVSIEVNDLIVRERVLTFWYLSPLVVKSSVIWLLSTQNFCHFNVNLFFDQLIVLTEDVEEWELLLPQGIKESNQLRNRRPSIRKIYPLKTIKFVNNVKLSKNYWASRLMCLSVLLNLEETYPFYFR